MKKQDLLESPHRPLDDLELSQLIACASHSVARAAQHELDLALAEIYLGTPLPIDRLVAVEKLWREARALADSAREAYLRARARHLARGPSGPGSGPRRKVA